MADWAGKPQAVDHTTASWLSQSRCQAWAWRQRLYQEHSRSGPEQLLSGGMLGGRW